MTEPRPVMTPGRAALIELLAQYARHSMGEASLIEAQKLTDFRQLAGEPLNLDFVGHHYRPYADKLRHVLKAIEGHYLSGFGDGSTPVQQAELAQHPQTAARIARVLQLLETLRSRGWTSALAAAR